MGTKTKHFCIYLDDQYMPLVTVISVPMPSTDLHLRRKVALWAWDQLHTSPPESDWELLDPEGEHLSIVGLGDGSLGEIKWFGVDKAFGRKKLNGRFNTHGESDKEREAYNQAIFETCKEFMIASVRDTAPTLQEQVAELIGRIQSCAAGLDEWTLENYTEEDKDQLAEARTALVEVLQRVRSR